MSIYIINDDFDDGIPTGYTTFLDGTGTVSESSGSIIFVAPTGKVPYAVWPIGSNINHQENTFIAKVISSTTTGYQKWYGLQVLDGLGNYAQIAVYNNGANWGVQYYHGSIPIPSHVWVTPDPSGATPVYLKLVHSVLTNVLTYHINESGTWAQIGSTNLAFTPTDVLFWISNTVVGIHSLYLDSFQYSYEPIAATPEPCSLQEIDSNFILNHYYCLPNQLASPSGGSINYAPFALGPHSLNLRLRNAPHSSSIGKQSSIFMDYDYTKTQREINHKIEDEMSSSYSFIEKQRIPIQGNRFAIVSTANLFGGSWSAIGESGQTTEWNFFVWR